MNRRKFAQTMTGAAIAGVAGGAWSRLAGAEEGGSSAKAHPLPFTLSVMLWTILPELPFDKRLEKVAEAGYRNVELVGEYEKWRDQDFKLVEARRRDLGISFDCTAGLKKSLCNPSDREALVNELRRTLPIMERIGCPSMILLSGNRVDGLSPSAQHQSCIDTLKAAAGLIDGKKIEGQPARLLLETIDPQENPRCYLTKVNEALAIVEAVGHPQVQLLYDFFHEQIAAGNLIEKLEKSIPHLGLVHVADVPGRHHPGTGEINYPNIFRKLAELNYKQTVAMEFLPIGDPVVELRNARESLIRAVHSDVFRP